ncbi:acetyl-CoA hydrolase/transferase family protein [Mycobacterium sp.]|uniref:acetyl-CoA hydrolase/transferase family protein n=1 Tax=Mycobacterium sp. TaxID=1785 RepID=UPI003C7766F5
MTSIVDALDRIPAGGRIIAGAYCGGPTSLLRGVAERSSGRGWQLCAGLLLDDGGVYEAAGSGDLRLMTWHVTGAGRDLVERGLLDYLPVRASQLEKHIATWDLDAALIRVTPPDADGWCSLGPSAGYTLTAIKTAKLCIAEVDEALPRTFGQSRVHASALDAMVPSTTQTPMYRSPEPDDISRAIARHVLTLLPDRPVLQVGIGATTETIVTALAEAGVDRLRFVGMGTDAMVDLFERGLLDDRQPAIESPDLLGTQRLMRFAHENPVVGVLPSSVAHSPQWLAQHQRLISVNTAVEIDLSGQLNSEVVAGRQIAGIGGSIDFVEAATHSAGGRRIIALPSTTRDGRHSRIVPRLDANATVTIPRGMVDIVVTEHGIAQLDGKTLRQRAEALIDVAAPQHRQTLGDALRQPAAI